MLPPALSAPGRALFAGVAAFGAALLGLPALAGAETLHVRYGVSLIGLPIGTAVFTSTVEPSSYRIEASAKLSGLASMMSSSHGAATATGVMAAGRIEPSTYATTSANSTMTRTVRMAMTAGTVTGVDIAPPFDPQRKRVPVTDADKRDIIDPLSAFLMSVPAGGEAVGPAACNRTLPVFDGAVRFDLALSFVGTRHVKTHGYDGDVAVCSARYRPISGHWVDSKAAQFMADNRNLEVWLAPIPGMRVVFPYRISVRTMVGSTVIEAEDVSVDATHASAH